MELILIIIGATLLGFKYGALTGWGVGLIVVGTIAALGDKLEQIRHLLNKK